MNFLKNNFLPVLGMLVLLVSLGLSYTLGNLFFDKLMTCSIILSIIFLLRIDAKPEDKKDNNATTPKLQIIRNDRKV